MFYFTYKNHKWLVEDRKKQMEQEIRNKLNCIFSIVAEYSLSTKLNKTLLPPNIVKDISKYNIPEGVVDLINEYIREKMHNKFNDYEYLAQQIIQQYRNGTLLNDIDFNKLRSLFKNNNEIYSIYNKISNK